MKPSGVSMVSMVSVINGAEMRSASTSNATPNKIKHGKDNYQNNDPRQ